MNQSVQASSAPSTEMYFCCPPRVPLKRQVNFMTRHEPAGADHVRTPSRTEEVRSTRLAASIASPSTTRPATTATRLDA